MAFKRSEKQTGCLPRSAGGRERFATAEGGRGAKRKKGGRKRSSWGKYAYLLMTAGAVILAVRRREKRNEMLFNKTKYQGKRLAGPDGKRIQTQLAPEKTAPTAPKAAESVQIPEMSAPKRAEQTAPKTAESVQILEPPSPKRTEESAVETGKTVWVPETAAATAIEENTAEIGEAVRRPKQIASTKGRRLKSEEDDKKKGFWANYGYLLVTAAVVLLVFQVLLQLAIVPSGSMEDTIPTDSLLISWHLPYLVSDPQPQRGDVITFWNDEMDKLLVKRVIGLPGEEITFADGYVYVNGERLEESYLPRQGTTRSEKTFRVPEGRLFMLGDNRTSSMDSRFWNFPYVRLSDVRAKVMVCIPLSYHPVSFLPKWKGLPLPILRDIHLIG